MMTDSKEGEASSQTGAATEDDYDPVMPEAPKSKRGEVYRLGRHRLMCGDSTVYSDIKKLMGDCPADLLLTDPPYNVDLILYTFDKSDWDIFYLLPFQHLRMAFNRHGREWCEKYLRKKQHSNDWTSEAVFVPASVVIKAIADEMTGFA